MSLLTQLTDEMKTAMKSGDKKRLSIMRMLISAIRYAKIDNPEMDKDGEIKVLQKEAKKRRESIEAYKQAGRDEQRIIEEEELKVIEEYLPVMMGEDEVRKVVERIVKEGDFANFGMVMNGVMKELKGKADGGMVSKMVKEVYQG